LGSGFSLMNSSLCDESDVWATKLAIRRTTLA
jgi:hypothetical protein